MRDDPPILKPCPFCGSIPKLQDMRGTRSPAFDVICVGKIGDANCQCHLWPVDSAAEAIAIWNTRDNSSPDRDGSIKELEDMGISDKCSRERIDGFFQAKEEAIAIARQRSKADRDEVVKELEAAKAEMSDSIFSGMWQAALARAIEIVNKRYEGERG